MLTNFQIYFTDFFEANTIRN